MAFSFLSLAIILISLLGSHLHATNAAFLKTHHHPTGMANLDHYYFTIDPPEHKPIEPTNLRKIKKGARCQLRGQETTKRVTNKCDGLRANDGAVLVHCCQRRCVDVLGDRHNCGECGRKCGRQMRCFRGTCTNAVSLMSMK